MILVTGGEGLVGSNIPGDDLIITDIVEGSQVHLDVTDAEETEKVISHYKPEVVVHCASWIDPDQCEKDPLSCYNVNVVGTMNVARVCRDLGAKLVYISTQLVFDGKKPIPYREDDPAEPLQQYGLSHFCAEQYARALDNHIILRTSLCHGHCRNGRRYGFVYWVIDSLKAGKEITVVDTLWTTPTDITDFGRCIRTLIEKDARGTYHHAGDKFLSRYEYAVLAAERAGLDSSKIKKIDLSVLMNKWVATRPIYAGLSCDKIKAKYGIEPSDAFAWLKSSVSSSSGK
ncbi:MAG: SDR family oxidoreductase [Planctomycetota bacterium]